MNDSTTVPDPADTLSNHLPSLPAIPGRDWDSATLSVLDRRFPIRVGGETSPHFDALIRAAARGGWDPTFLQDETGRAAVQAAAAAAAAEERFVQPLTGTQPMPAIAAPVIYPELGETELAHEWDTGPGMAILTGGAS